MRQCVDSIRVMIRDIIKGLSMHLLLHRETDYSTDLF